MRIEELLGTLGRLAEAASLSEPFVVGGFPRDKAMGQPPTETMDIDVTTGDQDCLALALLVNRQWPDTAFRSYNDGHASVTFKNIRVDFSNNFVLPGVNAELVKK